MIIYTIQNKINDKLYIGQTTLSLEQRVSKHLRTRGCSAIHVSLLKYGLDSFNFSIIDDSAITLEDLNELEQKYILEYDTISPKGYNLVCGGGNSIMSEESRNKISQASKGRKHTEEAKIKIGNASRERIRTKETYLKIAESNRGKKHTEESRKKMSDAHKGVPHPCRGRKKGPPSEETRRKLSERMSGKNHPNYGKKFSDELRKKLSEAHKGIRLSEESRKKVSEALKGHKVTEETREKIAEKLRGSKCVRAKLNEENVLQIRELLKEGHTQPEIAKKFNVSRGIISNIKNGYSWRWLK